MSVVSSSIIQKPKREPVGWLTALVVVFSGIGLFFLVQGVAGVAIALYLGTQHLSEAQVQSLANDSVWLQFIYSLLADGLLLLGIAGVMRFLCWRPATIGLIWPKPKHLMLGLAAVLPYYLLYLAVLAVAVALIPGLNLNQKQELGFTPSDPIGLIVTFVALVILPPIAEEIVVRGFLYTGLKKWLPTVAAAIVVSLLFGAAHLAEGGDAGPLWVGALDTYTLSLVLVFLREKTGNLGAGMVLHASKNLIAFVLLFVFKY